MNKVELEKRSKRKCASCNTLFYDFNKSPIICPACGSDVSLLTNVTKRGRPPKVNKTEEPKLEEKKSNELVLDDLEVVDDEIISDTSIDEDDENVENIIEIDTERDETN